MCLSVYVRNQVLNGLQGAAADLILKRRMQATADKRAAIQAANTASSTVSTSSSTSSTSSSSVLGSVVSSVKQTTTKQVVSVTTSQVLPATTQLTSVTAPAQQCPELSKELVASFAVKNTIMLTVSDWRIFETFGE